jgi:hypothetical protein
VQQKNGGANFIFRNVSTKPTGLSSFSHANFIPTGHDCMTIGKKSQGFDQTLFTLASNDRPIQADDQFAAFG